MDARDVRQRDVVLDATTRLAHLVNERLASERRIVAAMEEESRRLHDELSTIERSAGRRLFLRVRGAVIRAASATRHPVFAAESAARRIASSPVLTFPLQSIRDLRRRTLPLRFTLASSSSDAAGPHSPQRLRWIGPVTVRHETAESLLCYPESSIEYRITVPRGSRFMTGCALSPDSWQHRPDAVEFVVTLSVPSSGWRHEATRLVDPVRRPTDRRWVPLTIALPDTAGAGVDVLVTLGTRMPPGTHATHTWALFGEPRFEWPRPAAEIRRSVALLLSRVRTAGLRDTLGMLRRRQSDEEAATYARSVAANTPDDEPRDT